MTQKQWHPMANKQTTSRKSMKNTCSSSLYQLYCLAVIWFGLQHTIFVPVMVHMNIKPKHSNMFIFQTSTQLSAYGWCRQKVSESSKILSRLLNHWISCTKPFSGYSKYIFAENWKIKSVTILGLRCESKMKGHFQDNNSLEDF